MTAVKSVNFLKCFFLIYVLSKLKKVIIQRQSFDDSNLYT
jgi:hypothetical protein